MNRPGCCRCCGVPVEGTRARMRVCVGCDDCDELHGNKLQGILMAAVAQGKIDPYKALTRAMVDDAQLTGRLVYRVCGLNDAGQPIVDIDIPNPPPRWLVVCGRAVAAGEEPDLQAVVGSVLESYMGRDNTEANRERMRLELRDAVMFVDPSIVDVEVTANRDALDPENVRIEIRAKTPTLGSVVAADADAVIPADIMSRKRAEA